MDVVPHPVLAFQGLFARPRLVERAGRVGDILTVVIEIKEVGATQVEVPEPAKKLI